MLFAHHDLDQVVGTLGWVVVGNMCLGGKHTPDVVNDTITRWSSLDLSTMSLNL